MPRVIIWSECQFTKLALKEIISKKVPYVNGVISFDQSEQVQLYTKDYLIIDPSAGGFHKCYEFLRENLNVLDPERILIVSSAVDVLMLELLLKKEFKFLKKKKELSDVENAVEQFIQLRGTPINKEAFNYNITRMEEKVLVMMMSGLSVTSISNILKLSVKTISVHKCNSLRKIGVDASSSSALFFLHRHAVGN
ncbi:helix-turn-helix transcriptional regulator [Rahnella sp. Lac-M11]|jgi:two-component system capsular synthesis response regulator RcsB|uniref:Helix-turn-helix transcriptional regulator n=1 Tax=Rahnella contaminans TaxID=2703882 RepID=A0A6M2B3J8_9GAMM|nr:MULTISPECIES: helix-turn-helix transcriptional regulator [Rahnella]KAB8305469.1 LuxR family transcriptional regulator [Rouxiella chamberiensis]MBU9818454.1 helix-turn-helix transcriptional regulator [Rahnella sp. BCC 1045]NGX87655.1 helix-turn-helix transcriptional regulator [Rahnella contaminans]